MIKPCEQSTWKSSQVKSSKLHPDEVKQEAYRERGRWATLTLTGAADGNCIVDDQGLHLCRS